MQSTAIRCALSTSGLKVGVKCFLASTSIVYASVSCHRGVLKIANCTALSDQVHAMHARWCMGRRTSHHGMQKWA